MCPPSTTPQDGGGYAVQVKAEINDITLYNGWNEKRQVWQSIAQNISAQACGLLRLPSLQVDIKQDGLVFDTSRAKLSSPVDLFNETDFALALQPTGPAVNKITGVEPDTSLGLAATTPLRATVLPGSGNGGDFACVTTANATLSTGPSRVVPPGRGSAGPRQGDGEPWTVHGTPLRPKPGGNLIGATATIAGNDFALPVFDDDPKGCSFFGFTLNIAFGGADANGDSYFVPGDDSYGPVHPAGAGWAQGTLTITEVDPKAIPPVPLAGAVVPACQLTPGLPFALGVAGTFSGPGLTIKDGVTISKISGRLCGTATVEAPPPDHPTATVCTHLKAPAAGQDFDDLSTSISIIPGVTSDIAKVGVRPVDLDAYFCDDGTAGPPGQLQVNTVVRASAVPELFGTGCLVGPLEAPASGTLSGPLGAASVTLKSDRFAVNAVQPGAACPDGLADNTNAILGLPLPRTTDGLTIDTKAGLYLPRPAS